MTEKYAVIGNPIAHSRSPDIQTLFALQFKGKAAGRMIYTERILAPMNGFVAIIEKLRCSGYAGCNVTLPFKLEAFKIASQLTVHANMAQAVNTLKFNGEDNSIAGNNTDGSGLIQDIQSNLGVSLVDKRVLLIGAGGAAYGVALPLARACSQLTIVNRTVEKAVELALRTSAQIQSNQINHSATKQSISGCSFDGLIEQKFDIIINATSSSLSNELPAISPDNFAIDTLAYDMMYGRETPFMAFARKNGATIIADGFGMLVEQAAESFLWWRGVRPNTTQVIATLRTR